jgi:hypothetical protein
LTPKPDTPSEYVNPTTATSAPPIPPEVFPAELAAQLADERAGDDKKAKSK